MTKISLYIDDEVWAGFREKVFRKYGSLKKLSDEVESLLSSSLPENIVMSGFKTIGVNAKGVMSSNEIKAGRPLQKGPSSEKIVKARRRKRIACSPKRIDCTDKQAAV